MKKGELSMEVIVIAAIAVLVLVILSFFVIDWGGVFDRGTRCEAIGGSQCSEACGEGYTQTAYKGCQEGYVCCTPIGAQPAE